MEDEAGRRENKFKTKVNKMYQSKKIHLLQKYEYNKNGEYTIVFSYNLYTNIKKKRNIFKIKK